MSQTQTDTDTDSDSEHDEIVQQFIEEFDADDLYEQSGVWGNPGNTVALAPQDVSFGVEPIGELVAPDDVTVDDDVKDYMTIVTITKDGEEIHYDNDYISSVLDLIDEDMEYFKSNIRSSFDEYSWYPAFIEYEDWFFVVSPREI